MNISNLDVYIKYRDKFTIPLCIDVNFWDIDKKEISDYVLFIEMTDDENLILFFR